MVLKNLLNHLEILLLGDLKKNMIGLEFGKLETNL